MITGTTHVIPEPVQASFEPAGRVAAAFGRRTFLLCAAGLVLLGPAFLNPRILWAILAWNAVVLLAWWIDLRMMPAPRLLEARREFAGALALDSSACMRLSISGRSRLPLRMRVTLDLPPALAEAPAEETLLFPATGSNTLELTLRPRQRGDAELGMVFLRYQSPIGLAERRGKANLRQTVRVFPNTGDRTEQSMSLLRTRRIETMRRFSRRKGQGREFESLREYRQGDALRDVCWTATARRSHLVVREYRIERSQPVWIVLDCGRLMRAQVADRTKLDYATAAALNLAEVAMFGGDRVALLAYGRQRPRMVGLGRGDEHLRTIMDQLSLVEAEPGEADHHAAAGELLLRQSRRSLVVWITDLPDTAITPEVIEGASVLLGRHLVVFCAIADPELNAAAVRPAGKSGQVFPIAAAMDVLHRRERLVASLRGLGAHTLETGVDGLASVVVQEYLSIKERELL